MRFVLLGVIAFTLAASPHTQPSPAASTGVTVKVIKTMIADVRIKGQPAAANDVVK